jgi:glutaredoxin
MRALCEKHKLAVGADGKCVVCRRPLGGALGFQPERVESVLSKVVTFLLGIGLLAAVGALAYLSTLPEPYTGPKQMGGRAPEDDTSLATVRPAVIPAEPDAGLVPSLTATTDAAVAPAVEATAAAKQPEAAEPEAPPKLDPKARYAARAKVPVTLYTAGWCDLCNQARDYLIVRGVAVQSVDIEADKAAHERLLKFNKTASLPSFEVAGKPVVGFIPGELEATIDAAAGTHL